MDAFEMLEMMSREFGDAENAIDACDAEEPLSIKLCIRDVTQAMMSVHRIIRDFKRVKRMPDVC